MRFVTRAAIAAAAAIVLGACSASEPSDVGDHAPPAASETPGGGESADRELATAEQASRAWRTWEEVYAAGYPGPLTARYTSEASLVIGGAPPIEGAGRIARYHELVFAKLAERERAVVAALARDGEAVTLSRVGGVHRGDARGAPASGEEIGRLELARFTVEADGRIARHEVYADALTLAAQLGRRDVEHREADAPPEAEIGFYREGEGDEARALEAVKALVDALNTRDAEAFADRFAEGGGLIDVAAPSDAAERQSMAAQLRAMGSAFSDLEMRVKDAWAAGPLAVALGELAGTHDGTWRRLDAPASGARFATPAALLVATDEGRVERAWLVYDALAIARAIERAE